MKLLLISTSFPVSEDGSEAAGSFVKDFVETLKEQGHSVAVVAPVTGYKQYSQNNGIDYFWFSVPKLPLSLLSLKKPKNWWPILTTLLQGKKTLDQAIYKFQPEHIFALWALPSGYWARYAKKRYSIPYSIWALGSDIWSLGKIPVVRNYLKIVLQDANQRFADGYKLAEDVTNLSERPCCFLPSTRLLPVCGLPLTQSKPPYRLCFLGRWHPNKGIDLLLEALQLLRDEDWVNIEDMRIAGGGPMENFVKKQVAELQKNGRPVSLSGFKDKFEAAKLLIWTDYVIIPSRVESIPVIFSDAMQAMRPVIATPVGDLPELVDSFNCGSCSSSINAKRLSQTISLLLFSDSTEMNLGIVAAKQQFSLPSITINFTNTVSS